MYDVAHIGVVVKDADLSTDFYTKVLGCEVVDGHEDDNLKLVFLRSGETIIELVKHKDREDERQVGAIDHIAFKVDDIDAEIARIKGHGVSFLTDAPIAMEAMKIIFFTGPNGERFELVETL